MSKYSEYMKMGLEESRYFQMMKSFNNDEEMIDDAIKEWGIEKVNKGYDIFDFDGTGLLEIEEIGATDAFGGSDDRAAEEAIADGIKVIPTYELPKNFDRSYIGWIDTPENRKAIEDYCSKDNYYCNGNSLR